MLKTSWFSLASDLLNTDMIVKNRHLSLLSSILKVFLDIDLYVDGLLSNKPSKNATFKHIHDTFSKGVSEGSHYDYLVHKFGKCNVVLPEKSTLKLLVEECLHPFFIFQIFSITLWMFDNYVIYATCILLTSIISLIAELYDIKTNIKNLK